MRVLAGTSGFGYDAWSGRFYPASLPAAARLAYYASRLEAVEVNATFRRMPTPAMLARWAQAVPPGFAFALKAPQQITHVRRLRGAGPALDRLSEAAAALGEHRGPVLYQLPPTLAADVPLLHDFLEALPAGPAAFEFRHPSWLDDRVFAGLAAAGAALCIADTDEASTPFVPTAPFGYLRLRRAEYSDRDLARWLERVEGAPWSKVLVFFKHEDEARGPELALRLRALSGAEEADRGVPAPP
jgi:uncharacterized protein YecE (DUF72 family)